MEDMSVEPISLDVLLASVGK
ncbi:MaoC family dehydratase, partial [Mesorhizobium sp. M2D.F.Ca.ET.145.01.1.1]